MPMYAIPLHSAEKPPRGAGDGTKTAEGEYVYKPPDRWGVYFWDQLWADDPTGVGVRLLEDAVFMDGFTGEKNYRGLGALQVQI